MDCSPQYSLASDWNISTLTRSNSTSPSNLVILPPTWSYLPTINATIKVWKALQQTSASLHTQALQPLYKLGIYSTLMVSKPSNIYQIPTTYQPRTFISTYESATYPQCLWSLIQKQRTCSCYTTHQQLKQKGSPISMICYPVLTRKRKPFPVNFWEAILQNWHAP